MTGPTIIDIPHRLGRDEAKRRLASRIGELPAHLPGGVADIRTGWPGEYRMALDITALGQHVASTLDVQDSAIRVSLVLPPALSFLSGAITAAVRAKGSQLLLGDQSRG